MPIASAKRYDAKQSEDGDVFLGHYLPHPTPPATPAQELPPGRFTSGRRTAFTRGLVGVGLAGHRCCGAGRDSRTLRQYYFAIIVVLRPHESETVAFPLFTQPLTTLLRQFDTGGRICLLPDWNLTLNL